MPKYAIKNQTNLDYKKQAVTNMATARLIFYERFILVLRLLPKNLAAHLHSPTPLRI